MKKIKSLLRLHLDVPSIIIILILLYLIYKPTVQFLALQASNLAALSGTKEVLKDFGINILSDIIAAIIIGLSVYYIFKINYKSNLAGEFTAYDIKETTNAGVVTIQKTKWGTVELTYNLFSNNLKGLLKDDTGKIEIKIDAKFERGEYLRGYYIEKNVQIRRRTGAFLLMLNGEGDKFEGKYVFVDPDKNNALPQFGEACWEKK